MMGRHTSFIVNTKNIQNDVNIKIEENNEKSKWITDSPEILIEEILDSLSEPENNSSKSDDHDKNAKPFKKLKFMSRSMTFKVPKSLEMFDKNQMN